VVPVVTTEAPCPHTKLRMETWPDRRQDWRCLGCQARIRFVAGKPTVLEPRK